MSVNQIVTPLDSAVLENKEQYAIYFKIVNHAFDSLVKSITQHDMCNAMEVSFLKQYCELLSYSLESFRVKYLYDEEESMRIDLTESGFPNYLEFRYLINDLDLKSEHISKLPDVDSLRKEFLNTLMKKKEPISKRRMAQAASIVYYSSVERNYIFKRFVQGKIVNIENNPDAPYLVSWSFYDVTYNRPFICFMYFDLHKTDIHEYTSVIYDVLERVADRDISLDNMAYAIDRRLPKLLPKQLRKIDFGPLHNVFAKDDLELTHLILEGIVNKTLDLSSYAISLTIDDIISTGKVTEGSIFNRQHLQIWKSHAPKKYLFCPHRVIQQLYDKMPKEVNKLAHEPIEIPALKI